MCLETCEGSYAPNGRRNSILTFMTLIRIIPTFSKTPCFFGLFIFPFTQTVLLQKPSPNRGDFRTEPLLLFRRALPPRGGVPKPPWCHWSTSARGAQRRWLSALGRAGGFQTIGKSERSQKISKEVRFGPFS